MSIDTRPCTRKSSQPIDSNAENELVCVCDSQTQVQGTTDFHHEIADTLLPQPDPVFDDATALDTTNQWY